MDKSPVVYVVVLNWNNGADTIRCIETLFMSDYKNLNIVICDNGSTDESVEVIETWARARVISCCSLRKEVVPQYEDRVDDLRLIQILNGENIGYARGNNVGIRFSLSRKADYVFVLNNDTTVSPTAISRLIDFGQIHPDAALMAPKIFQPSGNGFVDSKTVGSANPPRLMLLPTWLYPHYTQNTINVPQTTAFQIYYAPGCAMMFRSTTFAASGLFDEKTFLYYEEFIMAEKLKQAGLETYYVPDAEVWHLHGATTAKIIPAHKYIYSVVSQKYYFSKYRGVGWLPIAALTLKVTIAFLMRTIVEVGYRRNLVRFLRSYYLGHKVDSNDH